MSNRDAVLLKDMNHKLAAVLEGQAAMASVPGDLARLKEYAREIKSDLGTIKHVLKEHSRLLEESHY